MQAAQQQYSAKLSAECAVSWPHSVREIAEMIFLLKYTIVYEGNQGIFVLYLISDGSYVVIRPTVRGLGSLI